MFHEWQASALGMFDIKTYQAVLKMIIKGEYILLVLSVLATSISVLQR